MEQNNAKQLDPYSTQAQSQLVLDYFRAGSGGPKQTWDPNWVSSTESFAQGKVAMMFGTSWTAFEIQSKNPKLDFAVAPVPQLPGSQIGMANYWSEGVVNTTDQNKIDASWKFLTYLAQKETQQRLFAIQGKSRLFGEPYSRADLAPEILANPYIGGIVQTAPGARSTYMSDKTFGGGFNDEIITIYKDLVDGKIPLETATSEISTLTKKYGIK
jgi:multiple sugar transport system substrate-binding protein